MAAPADRSKLALPAAAELRDRADRMSEQAGRGTRPRRRFLTAQRSRLASRARPTLGVIGGATGLIAVLELLGAGSGTSRPSASLAYSRAAPLALILVAVFVGTCAVVVPVARKSFAALVTVVAAAAVATLLGWAEAVRASGGGASPYLIALPITLVAFVALLPIPWRVAAGIGAWGYFSLVYATSELPIGTHVIMVMVGLGGVIVVRRRHKFALEQFLRVERLTAAVSRMRRVQEQLVVVEKLEALRVLVGGMAHELNNALAVSVASNQQALREIEGHLPVAASAIKRSDGGLTRIRRTVDRLRRFAMAAEGKLEPADVGAMLDFALESAIGRARSGVIIEREYDPQVGPIECHVAALAEALFQIARNAVEAMPGGGTIQARVRSEGNRVILAVADEGRGIPADQLARVFDPFYSRAQGQKSGLGLSAVYGLVSALGGTVEIHSAVNRGTEVAIVMPRSRQSQPPPAR
jgi:signal transduction histidine kinase